MCDTTVVINDGEQDITLTCDIPIEDHVNTSNHHDPERGEWGQELVRFPAT